MGKDGEFVTLRTPYVLREVPASGMFARIEKVGLFQ
jgi:hypothetical protein